MSKDIQVFVLCRNAHGRPEFFVATVTSEEGDDVHLMVAKRLAEAAGLEPVMAFDEGDPAGQQLASRAEQPLPGPANH